MCIRDREKMSFPTPCSTALLRYGSHVTAASRSPLIKDTPASEEVILTRSTSASVSPAVSVSYTHLDVYKRQTSFLIYAFYHYMFVITSLLLHFVLPDISDLLCVCQPVFLTQKSFYNPAIGQFHIPDTEWFPDLT